MFVLISGRVRLLRRDRDDDRGGDGSKGRLPRASERRARSRRDHRRGTSARGGSVPVHGDVLAGQRARANVSRRVDAGVRARNPTAASRLLEAMARKLHATLKGTPARPDLVTVALVPARVEDESAVATLAGDLRRALAVFGPTLWLDEPSARDEFRDGTVARLGAKFYRSKLTGWMAQQEENHRFIVLQADARARRRGRRCACRRRIKFSSSRERRRGTRRRTRPNDASCGAVGAVPPRSSFSSTHPAKRPSVRDGGETVAPRRVRHHPLRLGCWEDAKRLARHVAGRSVGVILTGGGGHGLAHLGALRALEDVGVPIDCVGGTSQGALMAALYARHASTTHMLPRVKELVGAMSSPRHLLTDLTLPVLSIFSGKGVDRMRRRSSGRWRSKTFGFRFSAAARTCREDDSARTSRVRFDGTSGGP